MAEAFTIYHLLMRRQGALAIRCKGCGHRDQWGSIDIVRRVGRRGLGAPVADLCARLRCSQCRSADLDLQLLGDPHGFACMNYLEEEPRRAEFAIWLDRVLGPETRKAPDLSARGSDPLRAAAEPTPARSPRGC